MTTLALQVLILTFLCYAGYHASRKPPSIVKRYAQAWSSTLVCLATSYRANYTLSFTLTNISTVFISIQCLDVPLCSVLKGDGSFVSTNKSNKPAQTGFRRLLGGGPDVQVEIPAHMRAGWAPFNGPDGQVCAFLCSDPSAEEGRESSKRAQG